MTGHRSSTAPKVKSGFNPTVEKTVRLAIGTGPSDADRASYRKCQGVIATAMPSFQNKKIKPAMFHYILLWATFSFLSEEQAHKPKQKTCSPAGFDAI